MYLKSVRRYVQPSVSVLNHSDGYRLTMLGAQNMKATRDRTEQFQYSNPSLGSGPQSGIEFKSTSISVYLCDILHMYLRNSY